MLKINIPENELWDTSNGGRFIKIEKQELLLEHNLVSISKWESKWKKPFLNTEKNYEELVSYIQDMCISKDVDPLAIYFMPPECIKEISDYIKDDMTATTFSSIQEDVKLGRAKSNTITSEVIYYWMAALQIPFECEKWHLNRLITLIKVCIEKNKPPKKMKSKDIARKYKEINEARKAKYNTKG